jgi:hypothetical protein
VACWQVGWYLQRLQSSVNCVQQWELKKQQQGSSSSRIRGSWYGKGKDQSM